MTELKEGTKAPEFSVKTNTGEVVSLKDFFGKKRVVLYFYPKDDTPGCTKEACGLRDSFKEIEAKDTVILGVSPDGAESHNKFIEKFSLPFLLLCDEDKKISKDYGVWAKKQLYGKEYMGILRTTFIIGKDSKIEKIYRNVKPEGHNEEILTFLKG